jgi:hypothetical protein
MQGESLLFGVLIRATGEAGASIEYFAGSNLFTALFFNRALLDLGNRRIADVRGQLAET